MSAQSIRTQKAQAATELSRIALLILDKKTTNR